jgi:hypothetical protein
VIYLSDTKFKAYWDLLKRQSVKKNDKDLMVLIQQIETSVNKYYK